MGRVEGSVGDPRDMLGFCLNGVTCQLIESRAAVQIDRIHCHAQIGVGAPNLTLSSGARQEATHSP
jgi:hypothetical protein